MKDLIRLEKEQDIRPSPEIDAFMKVIIILNSIILPMNFLHALGYILILCANGHVQASSVAGKKHSVSTDYVLKVLGLDVCAETVVGSDMLRGVSGGQRKRVTTGLSLSSSLYVFPYFSP